MNTYEHYLEKSGEYADVTEVNYPVVSARGLPGARLNEMVAFESGEHGEIFVLEEDCVKILLLSRHIVKVGTRVTRCGDFLKVPVGSELLGAVIDPLGKPLSETASGGTPTALRELYVPPPPIYERMRIKTQILTGVSIVDILIPLGQGQRQLVLGDRKTGKSSFAYVAAKNQAKSGTIVVIAAIGKKRSDIKALHEDVQREGIAKNTVIVATSSDESPTLIFLTPYAAMTIAEYFRDQGRNVLLVLDDLSIHARFYREISLISGGFPGRDSYPGDVFWRYATLLERAGNFRHGTGEVAITCLPIMETVEGDLNSYMTTNIMGMTDGYIYFDAKAFVNGRRPPIDIHTSVTRVGRQTQSKLKREMTAEVMRFLTEYENAENYSQFGGELSPKVKHVLAKGRAFYTFFDQPSSLTLTEEVQLILFGLIWINLFNEFKGAKIDAVRRKLVTSFEKDPKARELMTGIVKVATLYDLLLRITHEKDKLEALWLQDMSS